MSNPRTLRGSDVKNRAYAPSLGISRVQATCTIPGCGRPTTRAEAKGLSWSLCRYHTQYRNRHGSAWRRSYRASELKPYRRAAASWIKRNRRNRYVEHALSRLEALLRSAGPDEYHEGFSPYRRARIVLARFRDKPVPPDRLLATYLAVVMIIHEDPTTDRSLEFHTVQIAKAVHRLASGFHRRWQTMDYELHKFSRSSGRILRHLGRMIGDACELVDYHHLSDILALKVERYGPHPAVANPALASKLPIAKPGVKQPSMSDMQARAKGMPRLRKVRDIKDSQGRILKRVIRYE